VYGAGQDQPGLASLRGRTYHRWAQLHLRRPRSKTNDGAAQAREALRLADQQFVVYDADARRHAISKRLTLLSRDRFVLGAVHLAADRCGLRRAAAVSMQFHLILKTTGIDAAKSYLQELRSSLPDHSHSHVTIACLQAALDVTESPQLRCDDGEVKVGEKAFVVHFNSAPTDLEVPLKPDTKSTVGVRLSLNKSARTSSPSFPPLTAAQASTKQVAALMPQNKTRASFDAVLPGSFSAPIDSFRYHALQDGSN
jgi:hypothetical protein